MSGPDLGGFRLKWPWTLATGFGCIEYGYGCDRWRPLWNGKLGAEAYVRAACKGFGLGSHVFAVPLPEISEAP